MRRGCFSRFTLELAENSVIIVAGIAFTSNYGVYTEKGKQHEETNFMFGIGNGDDLHLIADECLFGGCCSRRHLR